MLNRLSSDASFIKLVMFLAIFQIISLMSTLLAVGFLLSAAIISLFISMIKASTLRSETLGEVVLPIFLIFSASFYLHNMSTNSIETLHSEWLKGMVNPTFYEQVFSIIPIEQSLLSFMWLFFAAMFYGFISSFFPESLLSRRQKQEKGDS